MKKLLFFLFLGTACMAQGDKPKPSSPSPKPAAIRPNDWKSTVLTVSLAGAALYDGFSTKRFEHACAGCTEIDPLSHFLLGPRPTWPRMATIGALEVGGAHILAQRMRRSRNRWIHDLWWTPEVGLASVHLWAGARNFSRYGSRI